MRMDPRRIVSIAAVVGGVGWLVKVGLIWYSGGETTSGGLVDKAFYGGFAAFAVALGAAGYTLVDKAPVWLRGVVAIATPLLVLMMWQLFDQAVKAMYGGDTWLHDQLSVIIGAVAALITGRWAHGRAVAHAEAAAAQRPAPVRGRRAAR